MGFSPRKKVCYPQDCLISLDAEWELVAHVPQRTVLEAVNFRGNELWLVDVGLGRIMKVVDGSAVTVHEDPDSGPNGMRFIDDHTLLIADRKKGVCTYDIDVDEYSTRCTGADGSTFNHLDDLVLDGQGGAYFTDPGSSNLLAKTGSVYYVRYGDGSYDCERYLSDIAFPNGVALSPDGMYLYVAEFHSNSIISAPSKLYPDDKDAPCVFARLTGGLGPDGLITDTNGNVYAAHLHAGEITVNDRKGWPMPSIRLPEQAGCLNSNLCIHDGFLYTCEFEKGDIWRIPIKATQYTAAPLGKR